MNAIAHAAEVLYAPDLTPIVALQAEEAVRAFTDALPRIIADGHDLVGAGNLIRPGRGHLGHRC